MDSPRRYEPCGCQILLVMDYVIAEEGSYFNLPARKEGIIPGLANMRLPRFLGERMAQHAILFDKQFPVEAPEARFLVNEVVPVGEMDAAIERVVASATGAGVVSAGANRKAIRAAAEPLETLRQLWPSTVASRATASSAPPSSPTSNATGMPRTAVSRGTAQGRGDGGLARGGYACGSSAEPHVMASAAWGSAPPTPCETPAHLET